MVRFFTLLTFLFVILIVACVYFYNAMVSTEFSINQGVKDLDSYFLERASHAKTLKETVNDKQQKTLQKIVKGLQDSKQTNDKRIETDNLFTDFISGLVSGSMSKQQTSICKTLNTLEEQVASMKRFVNSKTILFNERIETFPTSLLAAITKKNEHVPFTLTGDEEAGLSPDYNI